MTKIPDEVPAANATFPIRTAGWRWWGGIARWYRAL